MANIKSQKKRNIQNEKRRVRNVAVRSELKTRIKARPDGGRDREPRTRPSGSSLAQKRLGKAGAKGMIHKNQAARRTSRLMKAANKAHADVLRPAPACRPASAPALRARLRRLRQCSAASRATSTSSTAFSGIALAPLRSRSAWCSESIAWRSPSVPSARDASSAFCAGNVLPFPPSAACASFGRADRSGRRARSSLR